MAHVYLGWLSDNTGKDYRLPSAAEWEYAIQIDVEAWPSEARPHSTVTTTLRRCGAVRCSHK